MLAVIPTETLSIALWILFFSSGVLAAVVGTILSYHWFRYSMNPLAPLFAIPVYASGCVLLLSVMLAALFAA